MTYIFFYEIVSFLLNRASKMPVAEILEMLKGYLVAGVQEASMEQCLASWPVSLKPMRE